jgi:hypothetical protein
MAQEPHFNGPDYDPKLDHKRLTKQIGRIYEVMIDGNWRTLDEINFLTKDPQASISAQLRHLRKKRFGGYIVNKKRRGVESDGLWEYRLTSPEINYCSHCDGICAGKTIFCEG